jgi:phosphoserine phosphatase
MKKQTTRVILVRHGRSTYNDRGLFQGCCDNSLLTNNGHLQADRTGIALQNITIDAIFSSPLQRTQQTAKEICNVINSPPKIYTHHYLQEVDLPAWEGLAFTYVREHLAEDYRIWQESPDRFTMANNDRLEYPVLNLYDRATKFWQEILPLYLNKTILIISHGGTIRALISTALGIPSCYYHFLQQSNCGISTLEFDSQNFKYCNLITLNSTEHLGETLPKLKAGKQGIRLILLPSNNLEKERFETLVKSLQPIDLNCCLYEERAEFLPILESLNIDLIPLPNLLNNCYEKIKLNAQMSSLYTGLVIADTNIIQSALREMLGSSIDPNQLILQPGKITVVHYPTSTHHPIIQTINLP